MKKKILFTGMVLLATLAIQAKTPVKTTAAAGKVYSLNFDAKNYVTEKAELNGKTIVYRAYKNIVYVSKPVETKYQCMNIFIPEAYFQGKTVNGYNKNTAPIFLPNNVGGYMPATPGSANLKEGMGPMGPFGGPNVQKGDKDKMMPMGDMKPTGEMKPMRGMGGTMPARPNTILEALARGYIVASPGARGRSLQNSKGEYDGKAPAFIVDMKAAVRYLRYNDKVMPGNAERIISNGTSAGGALSALLGASGNSEDYDSYLKAIGAADAEDDIYAVSAYCPITNLDHADMAYEWLFNSSKTYKKVAMPGMVDFRVQRQESALDTLTAQQVEVSNKLKALFPAYVNSLNLQDKDGDELSLDKDGNGSFKDYVMSFVIASAQKALNSGKDLSDITWLTIKDKTVTAIDFDKYVQSIMRMKTPSAFDALDLSTAETSEFGTATVNAQHFTQFGMDNSTVKATLANAQIIKMLNPMNYIDNEDATPAKHWRIRHGTIDRDGSIAIPIILAAKLKNCGYDVDIALPWNTPHSGDYDLNELFDWIDGLCK